MTRQTSIAPWPAAALAFLLLAGGLVGAGRGAAADFASESEWGVMPSNPESNQPGVQRDGTLRIVRFNFDGQDPVQDQGTLIGWVNGAVTGTLVERRDAPPEESLLEIVRQKPTPLK